MRHALLLAGGRGRRFWPRSRSDRPKQFMPFAGGKSLLRITSDRLRAVVPPARQWVITNNDYVERVRAELPTIPADQIIGESRGLNTAPAIGVGAALMLEKDPSAVMMVQAADHWIRDVKRFQELVRGAFDRVAASPPGMLGHVALIGFAPTRPAVGYGYIEVGKPLNAPAGMTSNEVDSFREKPDAETAQRYLEGRRHLWNGCMFFWRATTILDGLRTHAPLIGKKLDRSMTQVRGGESSDAVFERMYRSLKPLAIEHAVVEKMSGAVVFEGDCGWEDVGTWESLARLRPGDEDGNVTEGTHFGIDTTDSIILADDGLVATLGVRDLIIIKDGDGVLVLPRSREGDIRKLIEGIEGIRRLRKFL